MKMPARAEKDWYFLDTLVSFLYYHVLFDTAQPCVAHNGWRYVNYEYLRLIWTATHNSALR